MLEFKVNRISDLEVEKKSPQPARILWFRWCRRGSALPVVLLVTLVLSLLGAGLLNLALSERQGTANEVKITQATYLAEAGINLALARLRQDPGWRNGLGQTSLPEVQGYIQRVDISQQVLSYLLRSLAQVGGVQRAVEVDLARPLYTFALATASDLDKQDKLIISGGDILALRDINNLKVVFGEDNIINVAAGGNLTVNGTLQGSAVAGGDLYVKGTIKGDATAGGVIYSNGKTYRGQSYNGKIYGNKFEGVSLPFPSFPDNPDAPYTGGLSLTKDTYTVDEIQAIVNNTGMTPAIFYRQGDLTITAGDGHDNDHGHGNNNDNGNGGNDNGNGNDHGTLYYNGIAIIAASGSITLETSLLPAPGGNAWAFIARGDLNISGGTSLGGVFIDGGTFSKSDRGQESTINGSLVTRYIGAIDEGSYDTPGSNQEINGNDNSNGNGQGNGKDKDNDHKIKGKIRIIYNQDLVRSLAPYLRQGNWQILSWRGASLEQ
ncbi:PilX N-terminal domain-containing pilus assembly protein [Neomoorella thermoacetica]|uniref:PilX N-terminal domain-containing pilus assembly protein n=1 Tax=Neomoorella thermoacetica TaxID=1525 RepID=UPI0008FBA9AD|nr:PilX N-terminal domain-containing pilus assembly protein [Moorella thermoacetica]OIQ60215.1 hypothetical protein MTIN_19790 [Moorella thermoacetica]